MGGQEHPADFFHGVATRKPINWSNRAVRACAVIGREIKAHTLWDRRPAHRAHRESAKEPSDLLSSLLIPVSHKLLTHWQGCASRHHGYLTGTVWNRPSCWHTPLSFRLKVWVHWMSCCWHFQPLLFLEETSESFCEAREATQRFITYQLNSASENECLTETGCSCLMSNWSKHHRGCQLKD